MKYNCGNKLFKIIGIIKVTNVNYNLTQTFTNTNKYNMFQIKRKLYLIQEYLY